MRSSAPRAAHVYDDINPPEDWFLSDDFNMPVSPENDARGETLRSTFVAAAERMGRSASMHVNVALRWDEDFPGVGVDPDVMWVEPPLPPGSKSLRTWLKGHHPPRVAVEIVSERNAAKDYNRGPDKYGASGTRELWVYDPEGLGQTLDHRGPWVLQVWRHDKAGRFRRVYAGDGPVRSKELNAWLHDVGGLLRVADDEAGTTLWPTVTEQRNAEAQRAVRAEERAADAERTRDAEARRAAEAERRTVEAEERLRALEAQLRTLKAAPPTPAKKKR